MDRCRSAACSVSVDFPAFSIPVALKTSSLGDLTAKISLIDKTEHKALATPDQIQQCSSRTPQCVSNDVRLHWTAIQSSSLITATLWYLFFPQVILMFLSIWALRKVTWSLHTYSIYWIYSYFSDALYVIKEWKLNCRVFLTWVKNVSVHNRADFYMQILFYRVTMADFEDHG